jgi:hypothetical protein
MSVSHMFFVTVFGTVVFKTVFVKFTLALESKEKKS